MTDSTDDRTRSLIGAYRRAHGWTRAVTESQGSWRWQTPYRDVTYQLSLGRTTGALMLVAGARGPKTARPVSPRGRSLHHRPLTPALVVEYVRGMRASGIPLRDIRRYMRLARRLVHGAAEVLRGVTATPSGIYVRRLTSED